MLSVLICARNEISNLPDCIESAKFADEIVVVDDYSDDGSKELAEKMGCKVFSRHMAGDWSCQRNFGIAQCQGNWIFVLDADERISPQLSEAISRVSQDKSLSKTFWVQRHNRFHFNKATHGVLRPDWVLRLFPKQKGHYEGRVHEKLIIDLPQERLPGALYHYTYDNWDAYFGKFNRYTQLAARQQFERGKRANFWFDIVLRPWLAFFKMYILKRGFLDGKLGFILSVNHFFYTMTKYVRLYYLGRHNGKL
ncbi:MAG TPA: glycosyltransferase family 2 protein [Candidatus Aphodousia gallistercoris]|nr:glycosyltransferase family 2 protein [Candidatus Aphodousia gallistercoris]